MHRSLSFATFAFAAALSMGADEVADAIINEASKRKLDVRVVRNGSRGMLYLEPLVEVETSKGRVAYGPVTVKDVPSLFDSGFLDGKDHKLGHGLTEEIPYFKNQERLTFARCGITDPFSIEDYRKHGGYDGLTKALAIVENAKTQRYSLVIKKLGDPALRQFVAQLSAVVLANAQQRTST